MKTPILSAVLLFAAATPALAASCDVSSDIQERDLTALKDSHFADRIANVADLAALRTFVTGLGEEGQRLCEVRREIKAFGGNTGGALSPILNPDCYQNPDEPYTYLSTAERTQVKQKITGDAFAALVGGPAAPTPLQCQKRAPPAPAHPAP
jgi:hypothetical protein